MTVQLRTQTIAQQDVLGDSQIKANSSQSSNSSANTNTADLNAATATATLATTSKSLDSKPSEHSTDPSQTYDDAEEALVFVLPDILVDDQSLEASDVLLDNEQLDSTNKDTPNELQAFIQNPRAQSFKTQPITLSEDLIVQASVSNNLTSSLSNITSISPVENGAKASDAKLVDPIVTQINTMSKLDGNDVLPLSTTIQPASTVINDAANATTNPDIIKPLIQADKLLSSSQQSELLVKPSGVNNTVQDQYLATRLLSENSSSNSGVSNINHKSTTADAINTLASSVVLNDEKDFQKGLIQQVLSSVENREHTLSKPAFGSTAETQTVSQQWRKEQLTSNTNEWGQRLLHVLSDKVSLQIGQQIQRAQIRLDPPQLGSIEIAISVEGDKTTVHLVAGNAQIREAMQQTLDQLRHSLSQAGDVTVEVDVGEKQQQSDNSGDTSEMDIAENTAIEEEATLKTTENSARDWLNRLV
ncbi:flagellar hook-length control protein FliK [Colwellia sp. 1_MG-2023]|uniref:flagellar hook-length control protein FliK n=1 Tax=unclassified Colwellia TaxID=196834 RepID=UPI0020916017|nr:MULTISPECIES: flagellar hook-length control protein FliK [unclassified Colwellia]MDO6652477.1 flagellar hook-length control protein FliK [Colwellia sp. 3_MG-2023]MDO6665648.1 flagellar hook-length control protein FliK [Colwellia sp. 2_MG-2023]MDO6690021.1 flagellar hook-length control protein FliK [Colwellia sp. 1_MG-2023]